MGPNPVCRNSHTATDSFLEALRSGGHKSAPGCPPRCPIGYTSNSDFLIVSCFLRTAKTATALAFHLDGGLDGGQTPGGDAGQRGRARGGPGEGEGGG